MSRAVTAAMRRVHQVLCALRGHDSVLHFEGPRLLMRCTSCGYDSPGWETGRRRPRQRFGGADHGKVARSGLRLVSSRPRRVA